jgi:hypothetical protein
MAQKNGRQERSIIRAASVVGTPGGKSGAARRWAPPKVVLIGSRETHSGDNLPGPEGVPTTLGYSVYGS